MSNLADPGFMGVGRRGKGGCVPPGNANQLLPERVTIRGAHFAT